MVKKEKPNHNIVLPARVPLRQSMVPLAGPTLVHGTRVRSIGMLMTGVRTDTRTDLLAPLGSQSVQVSSGKMVSFFSVEHLSPLEMLSALIRDGSRYPHTLKEAEAIVKVHDAAFSPEQISRILRGMCPGYRHLVLDGKTNVFPVLKYEGNGKLELRFFSVRFKNGALRGKVSRLGGRGCKPGAILHLLNKIKI